LESFNILYLQDCHDRNPVHRPRRPIRFQHFTTHISAWVELIRHDSPLGWEYHPKDHLHHYYRQNMNALDAPQIQLRRLLIPASSFDASLPQLLS
jgi:hypothetical protein